MNNKLNLTKKISIIHSLLTVFVLSVCFQTVFIQKADAQTTKEKNYTYVAKNVAVDDALQQISKITGFYFFYNASELKNLKKISIEIRKGTIDDFLSKLTQETGLFFKKIDNTISVSRSKEELAQSSVPSRVLTGTILDEKGQPLIGANVHVSGSKEGAITDIDGRFSLKVPEKGLLTFSYIGYQSKTMVIGKENNMSVTLAEDTQALDEVVVIGYGVVRKSDLTGSVGSVKASAIEKMPVARIDQAIQGRISGVQITSLNGAPGASTTIRVRGGNSINAGNEPLYVIDGVIGAGDLNTINPSDIESIEVLKDASSTAIYGSRGANGVILITTKRGEGVDGVKLSYNGYYGIQSIAKKLDLLNGQEAAQFQNDFASYFGNPAPFKDLTAISNTDWQDYIFRSNVPVTDHNLNISRATKDGNYFLSLNYYNQQGTMYKSNFERYQIRFNVDQNIGKYIKIGATLTASLSNRENPMLGGVDLLPTAPVYKEDGSYFSINQVSGNVYDNPMAQRNGMQDKTRTWRGLGNIYGQLTLFKDLSLKTSFGFDAINTKQNIYYSLNLPSRVFNKTGGYASVGTTFPITYQNENTLTYHHTFGDHFVSAVAGYTWQKYTYERLSGAASGFKNDVTTYHAIQTGTPTTRDIQTGESSWGLMSYLFRVNYSYKNRYNMTVSGREDGSSRLAKGNKWAFFPSVAVAWNASEEKFIQDLNVFSRLKIRATYGTSGSQSINPYSIIDKLQSGSTVIGNQEVITFVPASSANKNLGWEKTKQLDLGLEAGFFNGRLNVEIDYYHKKTSDLLLSRELPYQTGFSSILENIGSLKNDGFEITVNSTNIKTKDFTWSTNFSISKNINKILNLGGQDYIENGRGSRLIVGESIGSFWGVKYLGTWKESEIAGTNHKAGDPKLEDLDNNGIINILDGQIIGNSEPKFYGGVGNDLTYKDWTLSMFFDYSYGNKIYDLSGRLMETGLNTNVYGRNRDRWSETNPNGWLPRAGSAYRNIMDTYAGGEYNGGCSLYVHNGSYLRLKNINLQYNVPLRNKNILKSLQIYGTVSNLFTLTSYMGYSPDASAYSDATHRGFDSNVYPQSRTYLLGVKAQF